MSMSDRIKQEVRQTEVRQTEVRQTDAQSEIRAVVLAAGKGKRLHSESVDLPKVLREAAGRPLLAWVLDNLAFVSHDRTILVVGFQAEKVMAVMGSSYRYALQKEQLGTGHAVASAAPLLQDYTGDVLVIYGDMPLFQPDTYRKLVEKHQASGADCTMLTALTDDIPDYGRIIRDTQGHFAGIVEQKDCTPEQLKINEVNPGIYVFKAPLLLQVLSSLRNENAQGEYYLTDVPLLVMQSGGRIETETIHDDDQIIGVNTLEDLARCERILLGERS